MAITTLDDFNKQLENSDYLVNGDVAYYTDILKGLYKEGGCVLP